MSGVFPLPEDNYSTVTDFSEIFENASPQICIEPAVATTSVDPVEVVSSVSRHCSGVSEISFSASVADNVTNDKNKSIPLLQDGCSTGSTSPQICIEPAVATTSIGPVEVVSSVSRHSSGVSEMSFSSSVADNVTNDKNKSFPL